MRIKAGARLRAAAAIAALLLVSAAPASLAQGEPTPPATQTPETGAEETSLEELMNTPVRTGTLTSTTASRSPVSVTVITAEDIRLTPHRNLVDLIEVYVPGALVLEHNEGHRPGIRGIISDRNLKFLLLVNGRNMNQKVHSGAVAEIGNWDLGDVERLEIIRGPGSVTYGPGAIEGVINIITKTAKEAPGSAFTVKYTGEYDSKLLAYSYGRTGKNADLFLHLSRTATSGQKNPRTYDMETTLANGFGFIGTGDFRAGSARSLPAQDYLRDFEGQPQYKAFLDLNFLKEWKFWARYTNSGGPVEWRGAKARFQQGFDAAGNPVFGELHNINQLHIRQVTANLENTHTFGDRFTLETALGWGSQDFERRRPPVTFTPDTPASLQQMLGDPGSVRNLLQNFSEDEIFARVLARMEPAENVKAALGVEYVQNHFGPGWGDRGEDLRLGDNFDFLSGPDSPALGFPALNGVDPAAALLVGKSGWSTHTYSLLGELSLERNPKLGVLLSGRLDHHRDTGWLFSPRLALISTLNPKSSLKLSLQRSVRMTTAEQLRLSHERGTKGQPEKLNAVELAYDTLLRDNLQLTVSTFYYNLKVVGFAGTTATLPELLNQTAPLGTQKHYGLELEAKYSTPSVQVGASHSFVKLLDWKLARGINATGISPSDYGVMVNDSSGVARLLRGTGNDLNNWSNHATKLYMRYRFRKNWALHLDSRVFWEFQGGKDQLKMVENAAAGTPDEAAVAAAARDLRSKHVWDADFRADLSLTRDWGEGSSVSLYVMNLLSNGASKRYEYDSGTRNLVPRAFFIEEPTTLGMRFRQEF